MIRRLRDRHRRMWLALVIVLPFALWLALSHRPSEPISESLVAPVQQGGEP